LLGVQAQLQKSKSYYISAIGFWNVENLYDTLNDQWKNDEDFTPEGSNAWTGKRYREKIIRLSTVIRGMAMDVCPDGLAILGLCEVENKSVVLDLIQAPALKERHYQCVHIEGPDARGVDPSFVYNPLYFKVSKTLAYPVHLLTEPSHKTRDILVVSGLFGGEPLTVLVNHWPSRRGGELISRQNRVCAAQLAKHIADSVLQAEPSAKIVIMGDLNDDPVNASVKEGIGTVADPGMVQPGNYFNPMEKLYLHGTGTLAWQDSWNLFDQTILNANWLHQGYQHWQFYAARIYNKTFLRSSEGPFKGYPLRTYSSGIYTAGYSDHFPVYFLLAKERRMNN
jgi:hypothetical protein